MEIKNARITSTMLGREDHGIMTFMIFVELDGGSCGIGGYAIDQYNAETKGREFSPKGLEAISRILEVVGVDEWEKLKGSYIRVEDNGWGGRITKIGNLMKDKWFDMEEFFRGN